MFDLSKIQLTEKQEEFMVKATHRYNLKVGATRSGKSFLDVFIRIAYMILKRKGKPGLNMLLGVSRTTIQRNLIIPMQEIWGSKAVTDISVTNNTCYIFGEKVHCIGDAKASQTSSLRGSSVKYAYCDELSECNEDLFSLLQSRLDKKYSICDATMNPKGKGCWIKKWIDSMHLKNADIYVQHYEIFDNPNNSKEFVRNLCIEYKGTVWYERYILGHWANTEGIIYKKFADNPEEYILDEVPNNIYIYECGVDFGGNISAHAFVLSGIQENFSGVVVLENRELRDEKTGVTLKLDGNELADAFVKFMRECEEKYPEMRMIFTNYDSADPVLARTLEQACVKNGIPTQLRPAVKSSILGRIRIKQRLIGSHRYHVMRNCNYTIEANKSTLWDKKEVDIRIDDGKTNDIDIQDAEEYSFERHMNNLLDYEYFV